MPEDGKGRCGECKDWQEIRPFEVVVEERRTRWRFGFLV